MIEIQYDGPFDLATGRSRNEANWKNRKYTWSQLLQKVSKTHRTHETLAEYMNSKKPRQDEIKDIGGFVGGYLTGGKRRNGHVLHRQLITLDIDNAHTGMWEKFTMLYGYAAAVYSTHKHTPDSPRLRLLMPLDRPVFTDEYIAISRRLAGYIGIEDFDPTGFRPTQLMYWPSTSKDGEFYFEYQDGPWISADEVLKTYHDWTDSSEWPTSERESGIAMRAIKKQGDPTEKPGVVGAFCRTYTISEVIEKYLSEVYEPCDIEGRYTYREGSTAGGLITYEDKFAYSHHGTDPTSGKLCNAFDLVRLHKYHLRDEDAREGTPVNKLPSFSEMMSLAAADPKVKKQIGIERLNEARGEFMDFGDEENDPDDGGMDSSADDTQDGIGIHDTSSKPPRSKKAEEPENLDWLEQMDVEKKTGRYQSTINNVLLILRNDKGLKDRLAYDAFEHREIATKNLPWRRVTHETRFLTDKDDSAIRHYIEKNYDLSGLQKITDGMAMLMMEKSFHPVKDFLDSLEWDGKPRIETLLIDFFGAEDNEYTRAVSRKMMAAAVTRIYRPGCKYDYMPILIGEQGEKKSMFIDKLGGKWYSDSFTTVQGKESFEQLQGVWIVEVAELSGFKNAEIEAIKHYVSKRKDRYRVAYGRRVEEFPRQSVFMASSNKRKPLKDPTGGRRFWPVLTMATAPIYKVNEDLTIEFIRQLWAEAVRLYENDEKLYLEDHVEAMASKVQAEATEDDERAGLVQEYLETLLPENWDSMDIYARREFLRPGSEDDIKPNGVKIRSKVSVAEIWSEVLGGQARDMDHNNTKQLHDIMRKMQGWKEHRCKLRFGYYGLQRAYVITLEKKKEIRAKMAATFS